jgi:hypothetical protein
VDILNYALSLEHLENEPIQLPAERHPNYDIPDASEVIKVTIILQ